MSGIKINAKLKIPWGTDPMDCFVLDFSDFGVSGDIKVDSTPNISTVSRTKVITLKGDTPTVQEEDAGIVASAVIRVVQNPNQSAEASVE